jgi:hypothetical protein
VDWLIAREPQGLEPLISFRLPRELDTLAIGESMAIERIADHRPAYLAYEGPISGGRGEVTRLTRGTLRASESTPGWRVEISWRQGEGEPSTNETRDYQVIPGEDASWRVSRLAPQASPDRP